MKRIVIAVLCVFIGLSVGSALAKDYTSLPEVTEPTVDGGDLIVPDSLIQTKSPLPGTMITPRFHDKGNPWGKMVREGANWRIIGGAGQDVGIYIGDYRKEYKPLENFAKLEEIWDIYNVPFVKFRGKGQTQPCLHVN